MAIVSVGQITLTNINDGVGVVNEFIVYKTSQVFPEIDLNDPEITDLKAYLISNGWSEEEPTYEENINLYYIRCVEYSDESKRCIGPILSASYAAISDTNTSLKNTNNNLNHLSNNFQVLSNSILENLDDYNALFDFTDDGLTITAVQEKGDNPVEIINPQDEDNNLHLYIKYAEKYLVDKKIYKNISSYWNVDTKYIGFNCSFENTEPLDTQNYTWFDLDNLTNMTALSDPNQNIIIQKIEFCTDSFGSDLTSQYIKEDGSYSYIKLTYSFYGDSDNNTKIFRYRNQSATVSTKYTHDGLQFINTLSGLVLGEITSDHFLLRNGEIMQGTNLRFGKYSWSYNPLSDEEDVKDLSKEEIEVDQYIQYSKKKGYYLRYGVRS